MIMIACTALQVFLTHPVLQAWVGDADELILDFVTDVSTNQRHISALHACIHAYINAGDGHALVHSCWDAACCAAPTHAPCCVSAPLTPTHPPPPLTPAPRCSHVYRWRLPTIQNWVQVHIASQSGWTKTIRFFQNGAHLLVCWLLLLLLLLLALAPLASRWQRSVYT